METNNRSIQKFNDIIFENKNRSYGAYAIRKSYSDSVTKALIITFLFFLLLTLAGVWFSKNKVEVPDIVINDPGIVPFPGRVVVITPPQPKINNLKPPAIPKTTSGQMQASDDPTKTSDKVNEQMNISKTPDVKGADSADVKEPYIPAEIFPEKKEEAMKVPDRMPELSDLQKQISENIHYPQLAKDNGTSGIVYVTFVVEKDGSVSNVELLKDIGDGCGEEAMRVVKLLSKWIPGIYKGKSVRVQCNLPVNFRLK